MLSHIKRSVLGVALLVAGLFLLGSTAMAVEVGERAPDFSLPSTSGDKISLEQFQGKRLVLLQFYIADFGVTWTGNLSARKVDFGKFDALNVQILGIGADHTFSQKTFADSLQLSYPLLSDHPDLKVIRSYGVLQKYAKDPKRLVARRSFFLIDQQGIVRGKWIVADSEVFPSEPILKAAQALANKS